MLAGLASAIASPALAQGQACRVDVELGGIRECAIAVNPLDPQNIAVTSWSSGLRVSTDGGLTWSDPPTEAPVPDGWLQNYAGDPSLAFDSQGRLFWCYLGQGGPAPGVRILILQVNPTTGAPVAGPFEVPALGTSHDDKPWLAADAFSGSPFSDRLYVVWFVSEPSARVKLHSRAVLG